MARWYPTVVELGDGRLFTLGGFTRTVRPAEIFDGPVVGCAAAACGILMPTYPALHLLRDGRSSLGANGWERANPPGIWDINANTSDGGNLEPGLRDEGHERAPAPAQDQRG